MFKKVTVWMLVFVIAASSLCCTSAQNSLDFLLSSKEVQAIGKTFAETENDLGALTTVFTEDDATLLFIFSGSDLCFRFDGFAPTSEWIAGAQNAAKVISNQLILNTISSSEICTGTSGRLKDYGFEQIDWLVQYAAFFNPEHDAESGLDYYKFSLKQQQLDFMLFVEKGKPIDTSCKLVVTQTKDEAEIANSGTSQAPSVAVQNVTTPVPVQITPEPTKAPSSFTFGGKTIQAGQTAVEVEGKRESIIRITPEEMDMLIKLCPNLTDLKMTYCCMPDYSRIGELTSLKHLTIKWSTHEKDEGIPLVNIDWVANLTKLTDLNLSYNKVNDLRPIAKLTNLEYLNLGANVLDNDNLTWLENLPRLRTLILFNNQSINSVTKLASIKTLETLHVGGNKKITSIDPLRKLPKLKELNVSYCPISSYAMLWEFPSLEVLDIYLCEYVDYGFYYEIGNCATLKTIKINKKDTKIKAALEGMKRDTFRYDIEIQETDLS